MIKLHSPLQTLFITLIIITISCKEKRKFYPQCEETPKYYKAFKLPEKIIGYNNYEQAIECARKNDKPLAVYFTGNACKNCRKFEDGFLNLSEVAKLLNERFVFVALFVDDKTALPAKDQFDEKRSFAKGKRSIKNIGQLNCTLLPKYMHSTQPVLFIMNRNDSIIAQINYHPNKEDLINELMSAIED